MIRAVKLPDKLEREAPDCRKYQLRFSRHAEALAEMPQVERPLVQRSLAEKLL